MLCNTEEKDDFEYTPSEEELEEKKDIVIDVNTVEFIESKEKSARGEKENGKIITLEEYLKKKLEK